MNRNDALIENAKRLYVIEQMTLSEIAERCQVNERTIRRWKTGHNWDLEREQYVKTKSMFHEELYNFARKLMASIEFDIDNKNKIDGGRICAFTRMLPLITKIKEYEDIVAQKEKTSEQGLTPDFVQLIEKEILGIKQNEN